MPDMQNLDAEPSDIPIPGMEEFDIDLLDIHKSSQGNDNSTPVSESQKDEGS